MCDCAGILYGMTLVPLYATLGPDSIPYSLNLTKVETLILNSTQLATVTDLKAAGKLDHLKNLILLDVTDINEEISQW